MMFKDLSLNGAYLIELEKFEDERGFFAEAFNRRNFEKHQLGFSIAQTNVSFNNKRGTIRGMHFQIAPVEEIKLVQCIKGAVYDVIIDLRPTSPTYCHWVGNEITAQNRKQIYVPKGFAHGYQTLDNDSEVLYLVSEFYDPKNARGVRWNDPKFGIRWPIMKEVIINSRDASYPDFQ
ncbi:MAG: dTDP-4-dehydrorhamnose 3,5-epimerase [Promethearchaeota archaeon CR_4]|nr:MAG: dTDP-4-dehydrorhamnose 3,5-epimerase [Candidatus Lokiarchaeota archaeon CR_4]